MLRIGAFVIPVLLLIGIISMRAISTDSTPQAETLARDAGLSFITSAETHWSKGWSNITLTETRAIYGLEGDEIGYRFTVRSGSDVVGTIVVGGEDFSYQPLELVPAAHREAPDATELAKVIERDLDRETYSGQPTSSDKLLYLGYYRKFELYEIGGQEVAFHLDERMMVPKSELTSSLTAANSGGGHTEVQGIAAETGLGFDSISTHTTNDDGQWIVWEEISGVPIYGQYNPEVTAGHPRNCGPTAGAMIVDYYRLEEGFNNFDAWGDNHDALYDDMHTNFGTLPEAFADGWEEYADDKGYDFDAGVRSGLGSGQAWDEVTESIDDEMPLAVMFGILCNSAPGLHWNVIKGYATWVDPEDNEFDYMIVNDPGGTTGFDGIISWSENWACTYLVTIEED